MWKWIKRAVLVVVAVGGAYTAYDQYRAGYFTRPTMPDGAFSLSYKNGLRAILVNVPYERETRRYLGFPSNVPFYLKDAWSFCSPPSEEEGEAVSAFMKSRDALVKEPGQEWPGERVEAVCKIKVDNKDIVRGVITSVPRL